MKNMKLASMLLTAAVAVSGVPGTCFAQTVSAAAVPLAAGETSETTNLLAEDDTSTTEQSISTTTASPVTTTYCTSPTRSVSQTTQTTAAYTYTYTTPTTYGTGEDGKTKVPVQISVMREDDFGTLIPGVTIAVTDEDGNELFTWESDDGIMIFTGNYAEMYYAKILAVPEGYSQDYVGKTTTFVITGKYAPAEIFINLLPEEQNIGTTGTSVTGGYHTGTHYVSSTRAASKINTTESLTTTTTTETTPVTSKSPYEYPFHADQYFVAVGTYGPEDAVQLRYFDYSNAEKVVWDEAPADIQYGDIFIAEGNVSMNLVYSMPDDPIYRHAYYYTLADGTKLKKVGNCADVMTRSPLTVTEQVYDGSGHWSIYLADQNGNQYYQGFNVFGSSLGINLAYDAEVGDTYDFAFVGGNPVIPLEKLETVTTDTQPAVTATVTTVTTTAANDYSQSTTHQDFATELLYDKSTMMIGEKRTVRAYDPSGKTPESLRITPLTDNISVTYEEGSDTFYVTALAPGEARIEVWTGTTAFSGYFSVTVSDEVYEEFSAEKFFIAVGTYGGDSTMLRYYELLPGEKKYHIERIAWDDAPADLTYGDVFVAEGEIELTEHASDPDNLMYSHANYFTLNDGAVLHKVGNCADFMEQKALKVIDQMYDGSGHWSIYLEDEAGNQYYYGLNYVNCERKYDLSLGAQIGDVFLFTFNNGIIIEPIDKMDFMHDDDAETTTAVTATTTTETTTAATASTAVSSGTGSANLPQTGNNSPEHAAALCGALLMLGTGAWAVRSAGRRREDEDA